MSSAMSSDNRKPQPCNSCRWRKVKCNKADGETRCVECTKRNEECEQRQGSPVANSTPCEECKKAHVACDWSGAGACARCGQFRLQCTHSAAASTSSYTGMPPARPADGAPPPSGSSDTSPSTSKSFFDVVLN
ncbi:hypothetical protein V8D89_007294 [Ganoderma adspersum]